MTLAFNNYQSLEPTDPGSNAPNRLIPQRVREMGILKHLKDTTSVLDIGCNRGYFGVYLSELIGSYTGVEHSGEIEHGFNEIRERGLTNLTLCRQRFEEWAVDEDPDPDREPKSYDLILVLAVIAYIEWEPARLSRWLENHTALGGRVVVEGHPAGYMGEPENKLFPLMDEMRRWTHTENYKVVKDRSNLRDLYVLKAPDWSGMASRVWADDDGTVTKEYRDNSERFGIEVQKHWDNESSVLDLIQGIPGTPILYGHIDRSDRTIRMEHHGSEITPETLPHDWRVQLAAIEAGLKNRKVWHLDGRPKNILVEDGILTLIDYGMVAVNERPRNYKSPTKWVEEWLSENN